MSEPLVVRNSCFLHETNYLKVESAASDASLLWNSREVYHLWQAVPTACPEFPKGSVLRLEGIGFGRVGCGLGLFPSDSFFGKDTPSPGSVLSRLGFNSLR